MRYLFNFSLADFDTTASTVACGIKSLALQPDLQDWIIEEIDSVAALHPDAEYELTFPLLLRCLALMVCNNVLCSILPLSQFGTCMPEQVAR